MYNGTLEDLDATLPYSEVENIRSIASTELEDISIRPDPACAPTFAEIYLMTSGVRELLRKDL